MTTRDLIGVALAALLGAGCSQKVTRPAPQGAVPPPANSPDEVVRLLEWSYNHRSWHDYAGLFTEDYRFVFAVTDTNGLAYRDHPFARDHDLLSTNHLFSGGNDNQPAASTINLIFDRTLSIWPDSRAGKDSTVHKEVQTTVVLTMTFVDGSQSEIRGNAVFFVTRGDSASLPADLAEHGVTSTAGRWFIERWEDRTMSEGGPARTARPAIPLPTRMTTWGLIKASYL